MMPDCTASLVLLDRDFLLSGPQKRRRISRVTPLMARVERIVARHAAADMPMPNNPTLGELAGGVRRQCVARALNRLVACGRVEIERDGIQRRLVLACDDERPATAWGVSKPGHAPFSTNPRGSLIERTKVRLPLSRPLKTTPVDLWADLRARGWEPPAIDTPRIINTAPASTCQWPLWADGARPNGRYCGAPSVNKSWCEEHHTLCFPPKGTRRSGDEPKAPAYKPSALLNLWCGRFRP